MKKSKYSDKTSQNQSRQQDSWNDSRNSLHSKKRVFVQKPKLQLNSDNEYLSLTDKDALYRQNFYLLKSTEYQRALRKITADLNLLLLMNTQQFFTELKDNASLRLSLESCLVTLPRRGYQRGWRQEEGEQEDPYFAMSQLLQESILLIYHRISKAPGEYKELVYNEWLLDIPKLLDLAAVYGESNSAIVKDILINVYKVAAEYDGDTIDFLNTIEEAGLLERGEGCRVDLRPQNLQDRHYSNKEAYLLKEATKRLFTVKDLLLNLTNFLALFPSKYAHELATDYRIQERIVDGLTTYLQEITEWNLAQHAVYFNATFEDIRQSIAKYFLLEFNTLCQVFDQELAKIRSAGKGKEYDKEMELQWAAEDTYLTFCLMLSEQQTKKNRKFYGKLINILLEESEQTVFFLTADKLSRNNPRYSNALNYCRNYEQQYRLQRRSLCKQSEDYEQIYSTFKAGLTKFTTLYAPAPTKEDLAYLQKREADRLKREINSETYVKLDQLRYLYRKDYDDEPEEEDEFNRIRLSNQHDFKPSKNTRRTPNRPLPDMSFASPHRSHDRTLNMSYISQDFHSQNNSMEASFLQEDLKNTNMSSIGADISFCDNLEAESEEMLKELTAVDSQKQEETDLLEDLEKFTLEDLDLQEDLGLAGNWQNIDCNMSYDF